MYNNLFAAHNLLYDKDQWKQVETTHRAVRSKKFLKKVKKNWKAGITYKNCTNRHQQSCYSIVWNDVKKKDLCVPLAEIPLIKKLIKAPQNKFLKALVDQSTRYIYPATGHTVPRQANKMAEYTFTEQPAEENHRLAWTKGSGPLRLKDTK